MTLNELNLFFDTYDKVKSRIKEIAPHCTKISLLEEIIGFNKEGDGDVCIWAWGPDRSVDTYYFPLEYLAMEDEEIAECETKKAEKAREQAEREAREEKERRELQERQEYERLKKKYEGGAK